MMYSMIHQMIIYSIGRNYINIFEATSSLSASL
jgi:hypothetical protein